VKNSNSRGLETGMLSVLLCGIVISGVHAQEPEAVPEVAQGPGDPYYAQYPQGYAAQPYADPAYAAPRYADPAQAYADPGYAAPAYPDPTQTYADPGYAAPAYPDPAQTYADPGYAAPAYPAPAQTYADPGYAAPAYPTPAQTYADPGYAAPAYQAPPQGYADPGYSAPMYPDPTQAYADPGYAAQGYPQMPYTQTYMDPYNEPYDPTRGQFHIAPRNRSRDFPMFGNWDQNDWFGGDNPFNNPADTRGYWADKDFRPWSTGPFAPDEWEDVHPMSNMPWGNFPGWGDGFFGGFGPQSWDGVTPWGNDVPFRWIDPTDPRDSIGDMWDDALNTPNTLGRMPPGWTAPYISVPNPIDVEEEFERNARNFPDEMRKMINTGESDFGGTAQPRNRSDKKDEEKKAEAEQEPKFESWVKPLEPVKPFGQGFTEPLRSSQER